MSGPASPRTKRRDLVAKKAQAALDNESLTRERVGCLERALGDLLSRPLWGRLRWLLTGR